MAIVDEDLERLRATLSIVDVVQQHVPLKRTGRAWVGLCPFHAEKTGSFKDVGWSNVDVTEQGYHRIAMRAKYTPSEAKQ